MLGTAPEFTGTQEWFNTPGGRPLTLRELRGRVVLIDFWTYTCINCIRTLPYVKAWDERYRDKGLTIVGVHTPEFPFEREAGNVADAIEQNGIGYPVVQDNEYATWNAYGNQYWPAKYLIDRPGPGPLRPLRRGRIRARPKRRSASCSPRRASAPARRAEAEVERASARDDHAGELPRRRPGADRFANGPIAAGTQDFQAPAAPLPDDSLAYDGTLADLSRRRHRGRRRRASHLTFGARRVFLVLGSRGGEPRSLRVLLDGKPIPQRFAGTDVHGGVATISDQRLYRLVELPRAERHHPQPANSPPASPATPSPSDEPRRLGQWSAWQTSKVAAPCSSSTTSRRSPRSSRATSSGPATRRDNRRRRAGGGADRRRVPPRPRRPRPDAARARRPAGAAPPARARWRPDAGDPPHREGRAGGQARRAAQRRRRLRRQAVLAERAGRPRRRGPAAGRPARHRRRAAALRRSRDRRPRPPRHPRRRPRSSSASASSTCSSSSPPTPARRSRATS